MGAALNANEVVEKLRGRYAPDSYMLIEQAPDDVMRQGSKLDVLVCSLWRSRGFELHGIEIKVSVSDWRRELKEHAKADWWWRHVHRFYVAAPSDVAALIANELPAGWGLLAANGAGVRVLREIAPRTPEPMPWVVTLGLLRAAASAGVNALARARDEGYARGLELGTKRDVDDISRRDLDALRSRVQRFEERSGLKIDTWQPENAAIAAAITERVANLEFPQLEGVLARLSNLTQQVAELDAIIKSATVPVVA